MSDPVDSSAPATLAPDPAKFPYTAAALHPDADNLADYDKLALVSKGIEETHGIKDMDPRDYFGADATPQQHLDKYRAMFDSKKNLDLYGSDLKAFVQMTPEQQTETALKARKAAVSPIPVRDFTPAQGNEQNTLVGATAPDSVTTQMMAEGAKTEHAQGQPEIDPQQAVQEHLNDLVSKDRFARQNALLATMPPDAAAFAHDWSTSGTVNVDKLTQFPEAQRQSIYQLRNLWSPGETDYTPVGRALGGAWWGLVKNGNSFASSLNLNDAALAMAHGKTEEESRATALNAIRAYGAGGTLQNTPSREELMAKEFPQLAAYANRQQALAGMKEVAGVQPTAILGDIYGSTFAPPRYGEPQTTAGKIIYPLFDSVSYLLAYSNPYTGTAATMSMMKDSRDHGIAMGLDLEMADAMGVAVGGTQAVIMRLTAGEAGGAMKVSELALRQASIPATIRAMANDGLREGLRTGLRGLRQGTPEVLKSYASMYALNVGQELAQRFGDDAFIPNEAARADIGQQVAEAAQHALLPSVGFALIPAVAGQVRALRNAPLTNVELPELFDQHRRAVEALQEGQTPADVGPSGTRLSRFSSMLGDVQQQWIDAKTPEARTKLLTDLNIPNVSVIDSYFRNIEAVKQIDPRVSPLAAFAFTPENVQAHLPGAKVTAIDEHNIMVEHSVAEGLPAGRIRITREQAAAPTRAQTGTEIEKEAGQPKGWFAGLSKETQDEYLSQYAPRGTTSFKFSSEDGKVSMPAESIMWLAGRRPADELPGADATGTAGPDTFHHEIFHFGMEMLRKSGAMPEEFERTMAKSFPPREGTGEPFNEEAAADAYAGHVLTPKPTRLGKLFEPVRRFFSRLLSSATGRTELDDKVAVKGYFDALAKGRIIATPNATKAAEHAAKSTSESFAKPEPGAEVAEHTTPENELHHGDVVEVTGEDGKKTEATVIGPDKDGNAVVLKHDGTGAETLPEKFIQEKDHANAVGSAAGVPVGESPADRQGVRDPHPEGGEVAGTRPAKETGLPQEIPVTTPEEVEAKAADRPRRSFPLPRIDEGYTPVLDRIHSEGGLAGKSQMRNVKGEYDGMPTIGELGGFSRVVMGGSSHPDQMAQILHDEGLIRDAHVDTMYDAIRKEIAQYKRMRDQNKEQLANEKQANRFDKATAKKNPGTKEVNPATLKQGDVVTVRGEKLEVVHIDPTTGDVTLKDGNMFGQQTIPEGQTIYVEKEKHSKEEPQDWNVEEPRFQLSQPDMFRLEQQTPEDVAADWAKQQDRKRTDSVKTEIARRQTAPIVGTQGSIGQLDMFGAHNDELGLTRRFQLSKPGLTAIEIREHDNSHEGKAAQIASRKAAANHSGGFAYPTFAESEYNDHDRARFAPLSYQRRTRSGDPVGDPIVSTFEPVDRAELPHVSKEESALIDKAANAILAHNERVTVADEKAGEPTGTIFSEHFIPSVEKGRFVPAGDVMHDVKFIDELSKIAPKLAKRLVETAFQKPVAQTPKSLVLAHNALEDSGDLSGTISVDTSDLARQPELLDLMSAHLKPRETDHVHTRFQLGRRDPEGELTTALAARIIRNRMPVREEVEKIAKTLRIQTPIDKIIDRAAQNAAVVSKMLKEKANDGEILDALHTKYLQDKYHQNLYAAIDTAAKVGEQSGQYTHIRDEAAAKAAKDMLAQADGISASEVERKFRVDLPGIIAAIEPLPYEKPPAPAKENDGTLSDGELPEGDAGKLGTGKKDLVDVPSNIRAAVDEMALNARLDAEKLSIQRAAWKRKKAAAEGKEYDSEADAAGGGGDGTHTVEIPLSMLKKHGVEIRNPTEFTMFMKELVGRFSAEKYGVDIEDVWDDPRAVRELSLTAQKVIDEIAQQQAPSRGREFVRLVTKDLPGVQSLRPLLSQIEHASTRLNEVVIRDSREKGIAEIESILEHGAAARGMPKQHVLETDRRVETQVEEWARAVKKVLRMSRESVDARIQALENSHAWATETVEGRKAMVEWSALSRFGALHESMPGEIADARDQIEQMINESYAKLAQKVEEQQERWDKLRDQLATPFDVNVPKPERSKARNFLYGGHRPNWINNLKSAFNAKDASVRAKGDAIADHLDYLIGSAQHNSEWGRTMQTTEWQKAVESIYGQPFHASNKRVLQPHPEWSFLNRGDQRTIWTVDRVMNMLASVAQSNYSENCAKYGRDGDYSRQLMSVLSPADLKMVDWYINWADRQRAPLSDVSMRVYGVPVVSPNARYWKAPIYREVHGGTPTIIENWTPFYSGLSQRVRHGKDFDQEQGMSETFREQMNKSEHWKAWTETGLEINGIFGRSKVMEAIRRVRGDDELNQLRNHLLNIMSSSGAPDKAKDVSDAINKIRGAATMAVLSFDPSRYPKHLTGVFLWGNEIGLGNVVRHVASVATPEGMRDFKTVWNSPEMQLWQQSGAANETIQNAMRSDDPSLLMKAMQFGMRTSSHSASIANALVAHGVYRELRERYTDAGMTSEEANQHAMTMTFQMGRRVNMSGRMENQSSVQRSGSMGKWVNFLVGPGLESLGYELNALREYREGVEGSGARLIHGFINRHIIIPGTFQLAGALFSATLGNQMDDKWKKQQTARLAFSMLAGPFSYLTILASTAQDAFNALIGERVQAGDGAMGVAGQAATLAAKTARDEFMAETYGASHQQVMDDLNKMLRALNPLYRNAADVKKNYLDK